MNVGKRSSSTSNSSWLGTSIKATNGGCALSMDSSPEMVTVSPRLLNEMPFTFVELSTHGDEGIEVTGGVTTS